jgi:hypothetical protein
MVNSMVSNRRTMYLAIGFSGGYGINVIASALCEAISRVSSGLTLNWEIASSGKAPLSQ